MSMPQFSILILTYNEERNLGPCLRSLEGLPAETFIVDSGSTDRTIEVARSHGATVVTHPFETHAAQWKWALDNLPLRHEWILALDADNRLTPEAREEIQELFARGSPPMSGYYIRKRYFLRGRWLRHGALYPKYLLRLFRRDQVMVDPTELVDHHFYVRAGTGVLEHDLIEENVRDNDVAMWEQKNRRYAPLMAQEELFRRGEHPDRRPPPRAFGTPDERTLWKKRIWARLPRYVRPALYFTYQYVVRGGFLDGREGLMFHWVQAFRYRLLVDLHVGRLLRERRRQSRSSGLKSPS